jgi:hypothetical protein
MDKKQAMAILQLSGKATRQDAKAAFRRLAKLHHPDHFARDACAVIQAEKQMKAINQAYHLLKSLLPRGDQKTSPVRKMPEKKRSPGFADMVNRMKKTFWKKPGRASTARENSTSMGNRADSGTSAPGRAGASRGTGTAGPAGRSRSHVPPCGSRPRGKGSAAINRPCEPGNSFEQVFKPLFSGPGPNAEPGRGAGQGSGTCKRSAGRVQSPYAGYVRYMALKNRIQTRTRSRDQSNSAKVERISRIRPVGRVTRDQN